MIFQKIKFTNFATFCQTEEINIGRHWTVVAGKNNSGKSSFIRGFQVAANGPEPYRGLAVDHTVPIDQNTETYFKIRIAGEELRRILLTAKQPFYWSLDGLPSNPQATAQNAIQALVTEGAIIVSGSFSTLHGFSNLEAMTEDGRPMFPGNTYAIYQPNMTPPTLHYSGLHGGPANNQIVNWLSTAFASSTYRFKAERLNIQSSHVDPNTELSNDGLNLAQVINNLQSRRHLFEEYRNKVRAIFPEIQDIVPTVTSNNQVTIKISFSDPKLDRSDLHFGLNECGTGTSQVLCILYVVVASQFSKVILIDEPNSFLHPGAAKKLIEVLKEFTQHQFIISTHSPELIQTANPEKLLTLQWTPDGSQIAETDAHNFGSMRTLLDDLGVSLSDLFGLDKVIWVEGQTEANCFPKLLANSNKRLAPGISFVPLRTTGEITGKQKAAFFDIYRAITSTDKVLPLAIAFSLDSETLTPNEKDEIQKASEGRTHFLPRHTFENYLLHPHAISATLQSLGENVDATKIEALFDERRGEQPLQNWRISSNGAKEMRNLFSSLTDQRQIYRKVQHGGLLVDWLIKNELEFIAELRDYVLEIAQSATRDA